MQVAQLNFGNLVHFVKSRIYLGGQTALFRGIKRRRHKGIHITARNFHHVLRVFGHILRDRITQRRLQHQAVGIGHHGANVIGRIAHLIVILRRHDDTFKIVVIGDGVINRICRHAEQNHRKQADNQADCAINFKFR